MMRPVFAALLTLGLIGSTYAYVRFTESIHPPELVIQEDFIESSEIMVVIERTFDCWPNPDYQLPALSVSFRGEEVFREEEKIPAGKTIRIGPLQDVVNGINGLAIQANFQNSETQLGEESDEWGEPDGNAGQGGLEYSDSFADDGVPGAEFSAAPRAMRIRVLQGRKLLAEKVVWVTDAESEIAEEVAFQVSGE